MIASEILASMGVTILVFSCSVSLSLYVYFIILDFSYDRSVFLLLLLPDYHPDTGLKLLCISLYIYIIILDFPWLLYFSITLVTWLPARYWPPRATILVSSFLNMPPAFSRYLTYNIYTVQGIDIRNDMFRNDLHHFEYDKPIGQVQVEIFFGKCILIVNTIW